MAKWLDSDGLLYFWQNLKAKLSTKVDKADGKGLSANDYTTDEKNKLAAIEENANNYSLPTMDSGTKGGAKVGSGLSMSNEILSVASAPKLATKRTFKLTGDASGSATFDGSGDATIAVTVADDSHNHTISNVDGLQSALDSKLNVTAAENYYAKKSDITNMYRYKGSVATSDKLPLTGNTAGDVYNVEARGINYAWVANASEDNGGHWDALGELFSITKIENADIDSILTK